MTQLLTECCNCRTDTDDLTADQAKAEGWVKARGVWTCPECADETRREAQETYDLGWPALDPPLTDAPSPIIEPHFVRWDSPDSGLFVQVDAGEVFKIGRRPDQVLTIECPTDAHRLGEAILNAIGWLDRRVAQREGL